MPSPSVSSRYPVRLLLCENEGNALLARLNSYISSPIPYCSSETKKYLQKQPYTFIKLSSVPGHAEIQPLANRIKESMQDYYDVLVDVMKWKENVSGILMEIGLSLKKMHINQIIVGQYFSLLVLLVKVLYMLNRIEKRKVKTLLFHITHFMITGMQDAHYSRVIHMFDDFANPITRLQQIFSPITPQISHALLEMATSYSNGDLKMLQQKKVFELLAYPKTITLPAIDDNSLELSNYHKLEEWIFYSFLIFPDCIFSHKGADVQHGQQRVKITSQMTFLKRFLSHRYVILIYGNVREFAHELLEKSFSGKKSFKKLAKKLFKDSLERAVALSSSKHEQMRTYLRAYLQNMFDIMREDPGLLGPKFQLILCALTIAKTEVLWYFHHIGQKPKNVKKVVFHEDKYIGELIALIDQLTKHCLDYEEVIKRYHQRLLKMLYSKKLQELVYQNVDNIASEQILTIFNTIISNLDHETDYKSMRLDLQRLYVHMLLDKTFSQDGTSPHYRSLMKTMNVTMRLSRHTDEIASQLIEHGSLSQLYFYHDEVAKVFLDSLQGKETQPQYVLPLIRLFKFYPVHIHKCIKQHIYQDMGKQSVERAKVMVQELISDLMAKLKFLLSENGYEYYVHHLKQPDVMQRLSSKTKKGKVLFQNHEKNVQKVLETERNVTMLMNAIRESIELRIHDVAIYPMEQFKDSLKELIVNHLHKCVYIPKQKTTDLRPEFFPPGYILQKIWATADMLRIVQNCLPINVVEIVVSALLELVQVKQVARSFIDWYISILSRCGESNCPVSFQPDEFSFVGTKTAPLIKFKSQILNWDDYFSLEGLKKLFSFVGSYGAETIISTLNVSILLEIEKLQAEIRELNEFVLAVREKLFTDTESAIDQIKAQKSLPEIFSKRVILLGALLQFKRSCNESLRQTMTENSTQLEKLIQCIPENDHCLLISSGLSTEDIPISSENYRNDLRNRLKNFPILLAIFLTIHVFSQATLDVESLTIDKEYHLLIPVCQALFQHFPDSLHHEFCSMTELLSQNLPQVDTQSLKHFLHLCKLSL